MSPGLINPHDHITFTHNDPYTVGRNARYDHRHEWRKGAGTDKPKIPAPGGASGVRISWGELRFVGGVVDLYQGLLHDEREEVPIAKALADLSRFC